ncbi:hypothetical protein F4780DRAFT_779291 [Xylariomycetidae sp. FL0641]|nr:hypothetical protein F4780DRAFT_779291 [Xylariomycetidae sp. FL0641]
MRPVLRILRPSSSLKAAGGSNSSRSSRTFWTTRPRRAKNQIYDTVRRPDDLHTYLLLSSSARTPLLTFWRPSEVGPGGSGGGGGGDEAGRQLELARGLVAAGAGEGEGGVAFVEVDAGAPDVVAPGAGGDLVGGLPARYLVTELPTLLPFDDRGEPLLRERLTHPAQLADRAFLADWIAGIARRHGGGGGGAAGGGIRIPAGLGALLGGIFGVGRSQTGNGSIPSERAYNIEQSEFYVRTMNY